MSDHALKAIALADKVVSFAEDGTRGLDRAIAAWPAEFRAVVWDAVAAIAATRAADARGSITPALREGEA